MARIAAESGYLISLMGSRNDDSFVSLVCSRVFDGIVISSTSFEEKYVLRLIDTGTPVVLLMNREYTKHVVGRAAQIYTGIHSGIKDCVQLLHDMGRQHIVYIDRVSKKRHFSTMADWRYNGFVTKMQECGYRITKDNVIVGYETEDELYTALCQRIREGLQVDGIVGRNDALACVAMQALKDCGLLLLPEEIDAERGVILEEWRTRRTASRRIWTQMQQKMYPGTQYAKRDVIGDTAVINNFEYQALRDYYHKWYGPDNQAIIVVGDIDVDAICHTQSRMPLLGASTTVYG